MNSAPPGMAIPFLSVRVGLDERASRTEVGGVNGERPRRNERFASPGRLVSMASIDSGVMRATPCGLDIASSCRPAGRPHAHHLAELVQSLEAIVDQHFNGIDVEY
jgi:hypothetical protein